MSSRAGAVSPLMSSSVGPRRRGKTLQARSTMSSLDRSGVRHGASDCLDGPLAAAANRKRRSSEGQNVPQPTERRQDGESDAGDFVDLQS